MTKVEYCVGIGWNMLLPEYFVVYLEDNNEGDSEDNLVPEPTLELEEA